MSITVSPAALAAEAAVNSMAHLLDDDPLGLFAEKTTPPTLPAAPSQASPPPAAPQNSAPELPVNHAPPAPRPAPVPPQPDWASPPPAVAVGWTNSMPAPTVEDDSNTLVTAQPAHQDLLQALASLLMSGSLAKPNTPLEQNRRRNIVACLANSEDAGKVQAVLHDQPYDLTLATSPEQVTAMLQMSHQLDVLLLDPNFHSQQQGGATIMRYLNMLNPARRRRVFVVVTSHSYRSLDMQAAFTHGVNLVINSGELETLPTALSKSIQEFNNLYRAFNEASGASPF
jgi:CheY-like chemotaxis protein